MDKSTRRDLSRRYARGEMTLHELRRAGHSSMIELLSDLAEIGERLPLADMKGPNVETRTAGVERLGTMLRP